MGTDGQECGTVGKGNQALLAEGNGAERRNADSREASIGLDLLLVGGTSCCRADVPAVRPRSANSARSVGSAVR